MRIGFTGHQEREGIDWSQVETAIRNQLVALGNIQEAFCSLAAGSDQLFVEEALQLGIHVIAVIPLDHYERFFHGLALKNYQRLLKLCERRSLNAVGDPHLAFFDAGKFIVDNCDVLLAVWDGEPAEGFGGTADIVAYAQRARRPVVHINPMTGAIV
jgi:hypothetical protein